MMAICPPNEAINRILAALGLENVRSLKINAAVNDAVTVVTEQYVTGSQLDDLATALETKEWVLVPKDAGRWIPVSERLPEDRQRVIACFPPVRSGDPTDVCEATFNKAQGWFAMEHGCYTATHWMPLPEPPEVK
jgi:hypothetical protein